jgi:hypothetical protein
LLDSANVGADRLLGQDSFGAAYTAATVMESEGNPWHSDHVVGNVGVVYGQPARQPGLRRPSFGVQGFAEGDAVG